MAKFNFQGAVDSHFLYTLAGQCVWLHSHPVDTDFDSDQFQETKNGKNVFSCEQFFKYICFGWEIENKDFEKNAGIIVYPQKAGKLTNS